LPKDVPATSVLGKLQVTVTAKELLLGVTLLELGAAVTVTLPQFTVIVLQALVVPPTVTSIATVPAAVGMRFAGVQVRLAVTVVPLQRTVGAGVTAVPTVPVVAVITQVSSLELLELGGAAELLLGGRLLELGTKELLLGRRLLELRTAELLLAARLLEETAALDVPPPVPTLNVMVFAVVLMLLTSVILMGDSCPS